MTAISILALLLAAHSQPQHPAPTTKPLPSVPPMPPPIVRTAPAPPAPPVITPTARPPVARAAPVRPLIDYFSQDDYPAAAIRNEEQGAVAFRLRVGPDGRVVDCAITFSSGSSALDSATCRILRSRARFTPARDAVGVATFDSAAGRIRWILPEDPAVLALARADGSPLLSPDDYPPSLRRAGPRAPAGYLVYVDETGGVTACRTDALDVPADVGTMICRAIRSRTRYDPATTASGAGVGDSVHGVVVWAPPRRAGPQAPTPAPTPAPAPASSEPDFFPSENLESLFASSDYPAAAIARREQGRVSFAVTIGADGRVGDCRIRRSSGSAALDSATCAALRARGPFQPGTDDEDQAVAEDFVGEVIWALPPG